MKWKSTRTPPSDTGPVWIKHELPRSGLWTYEPGWNGIELGEWNGSQYQNYGASADREGLGVEDYTDITHWAEVEEPPFDYVEGK